MTERLQDGRPEPLPAVRLRGHHLLCVLTFIGKGYSPAFVEGMAAVVDRISTGAPIRIVEGPDDICAGHLGNDRDPHCLFASATERDSLALSDVSALWGLDLGPGIELQPPSDWVERMRRAFAEGTIRAACGRCEWNELCSGLAAAGFPGTRLQGPR